MRLEVRFVDRASGRDAAWGATGQVLLPADASSGLPPWPGARAQGVSPARQSIELSPGEPVEIRVGREIPFAGWLLRAGGGRAGIAADALWREVESALQIAAAGAGGDGAIRVVVTPECAFRQGREVRSLVYEDRRLELVLPPGEEVRLAPGPGQGEFFERFLAGYDPLRRVRPVDLVLRILPPEPAP